MNQQEKERFFARQLDSTRGTFPEDSEEVRVARENYGRALTELLDSELTE